jgi:tetratricopeptide (TPR) repeat protein
VRLSQVDDQTKLDFVKFTLSEADKQIARVPNDARYYILTGAFLNSVGNPELALPYIQKAIELSPKKQTMRFQLVQALMNLGRKDEAVAEAKAAYELDTNYVQAKAIYDEVSKLNKAK